MSELKFVRETRGKGVDLGEARLVPTPHLTANKVTVGNTDWGNALAFLTDLQFLAAARCDACLRHWLFRARGRERGSACRY